MATQCYARPPIRPETRDRLRSAKTGSESFDDVVNRLLDAYERHNSADAGTKVEG